MLEFLLAFNYDREVKAYYDNNHITTEPQKGFLPLEGYSFQSIVRSFFDLNEEEVSLLQEYYDTNT